MIDLNNLEEIKKLDPKDVYGSTGMFIDQCRQIHELAESSEFESLNNATSLIFCGMGGSAYGGHVASSLFRDEISVPFYVNSDYGFPKFTNSSSALILTSYSGTTEETIAAYQYAKDLGAKVLGLTSGGKLSELVKDDPGLVFEAKSNPSGQPRLGTGYIVLGTIEILRKSGVLNLSSADVVEAIDEVEKAKEEIETKAKEIAQKIYGFIPVIFTGGLFEGNGHILRNQFNETAKSFSSFHFIPEANHHVMEGLKNPEGRKLIAVFVNSDLYDSRVKRRIELTQDVVNQNNTPFVSYTTTGSSKLSQSLELLMFGSYLTFYTGILYGQDPSLIPWVDYFKEKLAK